MPGPDAPVRPSAVAPNGLQGLDWGALLAKGRSKTKISALAQSVRRGGFTGAASQLTAKGQPALTRKQAQNRLKKVCFLFSRAKY